MNFPKCKDKALRRIVAVTTVTMLSSYAVILLLNSSWDRGKIVHYA